MINVCGEVDLKTWYKPNIDKKTLKELSKRSDIKGFTDVSIFIVALILSGYLCIISWGLYGQFLLFYFMEIFSTVKSLAFNMKRITKHILKQSVK